MTYTNVLFFHDLIEINDFWFDIINCVEYLGLRMSTLSARAVFGVKAPSSQSFT